MVQFYKMVRFLVFFIFTQCLSLVVFADVTINTVGGASKSNQNPITTVWGVSIGSFENNHPNGGYDNCSFVSSPFNGCNEQRVNGETTVKVTFTESAEVANARPTAQILTDTGSGGAQNFRELATGITTVSGTGVQTSISFTWKQLCEESGLGTFDATIQGCSKNLNLKVRFGLLNASNQLINNGALLTFNLYSKFPDDGAGGLREFGLIPSGQCENPTNDNFGFCNLNVFPGDGGGYVNFDNEAFPTRVISESYAVPFLSYDSGGEALNISLQITALNVYYSPTSYADALPNGVNSSYTTHDIQNFEGNVPKLNDNRISNLENGQTYFYRAATVDESGTVLQLFDDSFDPNNYQFTPSEVAGLITESSCFITTATYGSAQAYQVQLFRDFRKRILWPSPLGKILIKTYNTYGPVGAQWIDKHPGSKIFIRSLLYPFYVFAKASLVWGFLPSLFIFIATLFTLLKAFSWAFSKKQGEV